MGRRRWIASLGLFGLLGLGTSILPMRFRVPPEIVLLTIRPAGE